MLLKLLAVGDVVGEGGQDILSRRLSGLREETGAHFTVVNGENASGVGITPAQARRILDAGADVITLGNHTWNRIQIGDYLDKEPRILRPANYAGRVPGRGLGIYSCQGLRIAVLKGQAHKAYVTEAVINRQEVRLTLYPKARLRGEKIPDLVEKYKGQLKMLGGQGQNPALLYTDTRHKNKDSRAMMKVAEELVEELVELAE